MPTVPEHTSFAANLRFKRRGFATLTAVLESIDGEGATMNLWRQVKRAL